MTNRFRVSSTLPRRLEELGLRQEAVLRQAGLPIGLFNQDKIQVSTEEFFALYRGIADASNDPAFGLKLGTEERVERYDPIKIATLSARSFRDAVERLARYKQLTCPEEIRLVERGNECAVQFVWLLAHEKEPPLLVDVCFAWIVSIGRRGPFKLHALWIQGPPGASAPDADNPCETYIHQQRRLFLMRQKPDELNRAFISPLD